MKNGHGKELFSNGDTYIGNYHNGKPENYGEYYWSNGNSYFGNKKLFIIPIGNFKNGMRDGFGIWNKPLADSNEKYIGLY